MKKLLIDIPRGTVFKFRGMEWILLEHTEQGGSLVLSKDIVCNKPFDEDNCNNFAKSSIRQYLNGEFAENIGANTTDFTLYELDLTADDGTTYGKCKDRILLLTTDIYRRNRDVLEPINEWWWTATAYSANAAYSDNVRGVDTDGTLHNGNAYDGRRGVRPLCHLNSGILVRVDKKEERTEGNKTMNTETFTNDIQTALGGYDEVKLENSAVGKSASSADGVITETIYRHCDTGTRFLIAITQLQDAEGV